MSDTGHPLTGRKGWVHGTGFELTQIQKHHVEIIEERPPLTKNVWNY